jgi:hypothetical protein
MHPLGAGIGDAGLSESLHAIAALVPFHEPPLQLKVDDTPVGDHSQWVTALERVTIDGAAKWFIGSLDSYKDTKLVTASRASSRVTLELPSAFGTVDEALRWIERLPFEVCSLGTVFPEEWVQLEVEPFGFGRGHYAHGWACAFRGRGHDRLVSRRWLEFGPWRVLRRPGDLTLVQFHDLNVDAATAALQARAGHERMGISDTGGYLQVPYPYSGNVEGLYVTEQRTLEITVAPGTSIEQVQMQDACAVRYQHRILQPTEKRIDQIAYVFFDEEEARAHLHELWLRELEVWLVDGEGKRRLDLTYRPTPIVPDWVTNLE